LLLSANIYSENDNLRNEYSALFQDVAPEIDFARIALGEKAEAINLWIGNSKSVTALHKDNYENIYIQVIGQKHFVLLPPICMPSIKEQELEPAIYIRDGDKLKITKEEGDKVPFATWDPDASSSSSTLSSEETRYTQLAAEMTMRVTLEKGDMLYLPALWYHKVSQSCSAEGICCAINYWHDMEFRGGFWAMNQFVRQVTLAE
jgi:jumonji domain-containing protein 7